jgi:very-short-patch-repair endonuclease
MAFGITRTVPPSNRTVVGDAELQRRGFRVLRFTYRQVKRERSTVVAALRALLAQSSLAPNL